MAETRPCRDTHCRVQGDHTHPAYTLVQRLRTWTWNGRRDDLMVEAAEELERLEGLNAELSEQVQALDIQVARLRDEFDR